MKEKKIVTSTMSLLASAFHRMRESPREDWREPISQCFIDISDAIVAGLPPEEIAVVCRAAARAILRPEDHAQELRNAKAILENRKLRE